MTDHRGRNMRWRVSARRNAASHVSRGSGDDYPKRTNDGRARKPTVYDLSTPQKRSPRRASRDAVCGSSTVTPSSPIPHVGKPPHTPRSGGKGVAETPSASSGQWVLPVAGDDTEERLARALEEIAEQQRQLNLQTRMHEESQTSPRAVIREKLQSVEFAEQMAAFQTRAEMNAAMGARGEALIRSRVELEMANSRTSAEISSLARAKEAEQQERTEAQRHRERAEEATRMAATARAEADTIRAISDSRVHMTEKAAEAKVAEKSASMVFEAEQAVRRRADQCEREEKEQQYRFRQELAEVELRKRTLLADEERAAQKGQLKLREEVLELELQKRVQLEREERLRERTEVRERSRGSEAGRAYSALLERVL